MADSRIIMHIDLDAFYAAVEQREHPEWRGMPVIVGADPKEGKGRGVVATASYEARIFGVRSAMPISRAWKLCSHGVFVRPNFVLYGKVSHDIMSIARKYADKFEQVSIDEAFLDVTNKVRDFEEAGKLAERLKKEILNKEKISSSIGIGSNKLLAKLASDYKKPYGLTIVEPDDVKKFIDPMPVRKLPGIGPKSEAILKELNVETVQQLAKVDIKKLTQIFGVLGYRMHEIAQGMDSSEVVEGYEMKSLGREITFEEDVSNSRVITQAIEELVDDFHNEISASNILFKTVSIKVRYEDFETHTRARSLQYHTNDRETIKDIAVDLVKPFFGKKKIRLIGVRVSGLKFGEKQKTLRDV